MYREAIVRHIKKFLIMVCMMQLSCYATETEDNCIQSLSSCVHNQVIFFSGYPGSGKGTQGKKIAKLLNISHLSTGELFRAEVEKKTAVGIQMDYYMRNGMIIPKEIVFPYLRQELASPKYRNGFILDGYPKDLESCQFILETLSELQFEPAIAFHFELSRPEVFQRLTGRLHCKQCENDYHKEFLKPKKEGICDYCGGPLESRTDDSESTINKRLDVFEKNTLPVIAKFSEIGILIPLDGSKDPDSITQDIMTIISERSKEQLYEKGSYFLRLPKNGKENTSVFHNHLDAKSHPILRQMISEIEQASLEFQNKIYPVSYLVLGPQVTDSHFTSVYQSLPNFHPIDNAIDEAFSTGKMGNDGFNYDQVIATLTVASEHPNQGVMTELEEEVFEKAFDENGCATVALDRGNTPYAIDWSRLPGWKEKQIENVPRFELHHGFDVLKLPGEESPPIDLSLLSALTTEQGFNTGGWFVFRKKDHWAYRSNEFSNEDFAYCLESLNEQADQLRGIIVEFLLDRKFTSSCSLEKVHAIWCL